MLYKNEFGFKNVIILYASGQSEYNLSSNYFKKGHQQ